MTSEQLLRGMHRRAAENLRHLNWALDEVRAAIDENRPLPSNDAVTHTARALERTLIEAGVLRYAASLEDGELRT